MRVFVHATGAIVAATRPAARQNKVTAEICADPDKLSETLTRINATANELSAKSDADDSIVFQDVPLPALGNTITLNHGLNRRVMWEVVDWTDPPTGALPSTPPGLVRSALDTTANTLVLRSYVAGVASIRVF